MSSCPDRENRQSSWVVFSRPIDVHILAIDGTWSRPCKMTDVSQAGAKLHIESLDGLALKEFFLVLPTRGVAYRRCELAWVNGEEIGISFLHDHRKI
ncbi:PilZ domain-containing protein [Bradyrhizobium sp. WSM471]|uniref:PilZ domain-containing protein n=1 Tax=Bradyrhizobium sp. WSM471 TaxID=319017 RepID=UPI00024D2257|nr:MULTISPECIES: PilZ domain-containing protein [Bradyrhizobium]EHR01385.1 PilZ domain-containing protein [Bradyrhizobium sp. WSM471]UFW43449.1 PilZ domain-containing protein [Bradyrhizobium canariense]